MPTEIKGAIALRKALKKFTPDLAKQTQKELASLLKVVVKDARGFIPSTAPLSGWAKNSERDGKWSNRGWNYSKVRAGITYRTTPSRPNRKGFAYLAAIMNKSAAGAIYETAGRKTSGVSPQGKQFVGQLNQQPLENAYSKGSRKGKGRLIFAAWRRDGGKTNAAVIKAIETSRDNFKKTVKRGD